VANNGIINAKLGNVVLASGNAVTLDMYGDGLVEVAVDGALENALIENKGTIKAEGGNVTLTASAAKDVVDNVINMDGVVDVSSVSVRGGKIILGGGSKGTVKVTGKLNASGTQGGQIAVTGENIHASETSEFYADAIGNGNGGVVTVLANNHADFRGSIFARGGEFGGNGGNAEVSGYGILGFSGYADLSATRGLMGELLLDPTFAVIHSGPINNPLGFSYILSAQALANSMRTANVTVQADQFIDVGTKMAAYNTGNALVDAALNTLTGAGNIDLSTWVGLVPYFPFIGSGTTAGSITFDTATLNINKDVKMGNGNFNVDADIVNLNGVLKDKNSNLLGDARISSNANTVNVKSSNAKIQQGIWLSNDVGGGVVNVAAGTYNESVNVNRTLTLKGANAGIDPNTGVRSAETVVDPNSPGFYVTADGVVIDGFTITSADDGVLVDNADNVTVKNNIIHDVLESGVHFIDSFGGKVLNNRIDNTGDSAVYAVNGGDFLVDQNYIGQNVGSTIIGDGVKMENVTGGTIKRNRISNATQVVETDHASGVYLDNSRNFTVGGATAADGNIIRNSDWDGIKVKSGSGNVSQFNDIDGSTRVGIYYESSNYGEILDNVIHDSNVYGGVGVLGGSYYTVHRNTVTEAPTSTAGAGIIATLVDGTIDIQENIISAINGFGIKVTDSNNVNVLFNNVKDTRDDGITLRDITGRVYITDNVVGAEDGSTLVDGNGISLYRTNFAYILRNHVYNTNTVETDHASGIYLKDSSSNVVGDLGNGNYIRNADWDGIKVDGGSNNYVRYNDIANSTRVGVYGVATNDLLVQDNLIRNSGTTAGIGFEYGRNVKIDHNDIGGSVQDGIYVNRAKGTVRIVNNMVDESTDDGIEVIDSDAFAYIANNTVTDSGFGPDADVYGGDGIHVRSVFPSFEYAPIAEEGDVGNGEYNIVVYHNNVSNSADDGIEILGSSFYGPIMSGRFVEDDYIPAPYYEDGTGRVLVLNNDVSYSGYGFGGNYGGQDGKGGDGIHVSGFYDYSGYGAGVVEGGEGEGEPVYSGYTIEIIGNDVQNSGDDGIEVTNASSVLIDDNDIINSGLIDDEEEYEEEMYAKYYEGGEDSGDYPWGADGIHVRNVWNNGYESPIETYALDYEGYEGDGSSFTPYSVVIRRNDVTNSLDDGIQVLFSGDTLIDDNTVENSGSDVYPRLFGGDGINVVTGINPYGFGEGYGEGWAPYIQPVNVIVSNNDVTDSHDDGIEVVGSTNVLIDDNNVINSGDDGINVLGFAGYYEGYDEEDEGDYEYDMFALYTPVKGWPYFQAMIVDNDVQTSGSDGIESRGFDYLTVLTNVVTDSVANGLYVSGFNNGYSYVSGNTFNNNDIGAHFESGVVDLTGPGNTFNGGRVGLRFAPYAFGGGEGEGEIVTFSLPTSIYDYLFPYPFMTPSSGFAPLSLVDNDGGPNSPSFPVVPPTNYGGTIGAQVFNGQSQYYVELDNGAFFAPGTPTWLNGLNSIYDGILPASFEDNLLPADVYDAIEAKMFHFVDRNDLGLFFFGLRGVDINQNQIFNRFNIFNGDATGLNVRILGLPNIPGGGAPIQDFNNINTFAGGPSNNPTGNLNDIETAAGGNGNSNAGAQDLNNIETQSGGDQRCWSNAVNAAGTGQVVNVVYGGSFDENLEQAAVCGTTF
jgi:parallel beta-helix repeat protein